MDDPRLESGDMSYNPKQPRDGDGQWTGGSTAQRKEALATAKNSEGKRWGRMSSTAKAKLTVSAQFATKQKPGKTGKLGTLGATSPRMIATPFKPSEPSAHAVAIQTAKALDKDFHYARNKAAADSSKAAIAKYAGPITKYPSKKPRK